METCVSRAVADDAGALADIQAEALPPGWGKRTFELYAASETHVLLKAAAHGGIPAGLIALQVAAGEAEVLTLAVRTDARRQSIATALFRSALLAVSARGGTRVFLEVAATNAAAQALYAKLGFETIASRRNYYAAIGGDTATALIMTRNV